MFGSLLELRTWLRFIPHAFLRPSELFFSFIPFKWQPNSLNPKRFGPETSASDLSGKVVFITGGNGGIGLATILYIAACNPAHIFLAARTEDKAREAIRSALQSYPFLRITFVPLNLASMVSVATAAQLVLSSSSRLDILILNAGIMAVPFELTTDGFEIQLATNHIGHQLLTKLLLPILLRTGTLESADARIVTLTSAGHIMAPPDPLLIAFDNDKLAACNSSERYGISKLANLLFARELSRRHPEITSIAVHPGIVCTPLWKPLRGANSLVRILLNGFEDLVLDSPKDGATNSFWAAAGARKDELSNGGYYVPVGILAKGSHESRDEGLSKKLWEWTDAVLEERGY